MPRPPKPDIFETRLADAIDQGGLLLPGDSVVVGFSAGPDSCALLAGLAKLAFDPARNYRVIACHLDHALRETSAEEANFARALAGQLGVGEGNFISARVDIAKLAREKSQGIEATARLARYEFFESVCAQQNCRHIATGHHADDQAETVLFRVLRGTGLGGLAGIPAKREHQNSANIGDDFTIIRPMLTISRRAIIEYLTRRKISWVTDSSNADSKYRRNFIRNELLPLVREKLSQTPELSLTRLASQADQANRFINSQARARLENSLALCTDKKVILDLSMFASGSQNQLADEAIVRTTGLRILLEEMKLPLRDLTWEHLAKIDYISTAGQPGGAVNLPAGAKARRTKNQLIITLL